MILYHISWHHITSYHTTPYHVISQSMTWCDVHCAWYDSQQSEGRQWLYESTHFYLNFIIPQYNTHKNCQSITVHLVLALDYINSRPGVRSTDIAKGFASAYFALRYENPIGTCVRVHDTVQYSTVQYSTVQYSTVQYSTVQYSTVQYSTVQYSTVQYSTTVQYCTSSKTALFHVSYVG